MTDHAIIIGTLIYFIIISIILKNRYCLQTKLYRLHNGIMDLMNSDKTQNVIFQEICDLFIKECNLSLIWIGFKKKDKISAMYCAGIAKEYVKNLYLPLQEEFKGPAAISFLNKQCVVINNIQKDKLFEQWKNKAKLYNLKSVVTYPIIVNNIAIGVIAFYSSKKRYFNNSYVKEIQELIHHIEYSLKILEKNKLFFKLFESSPNGICITNADSEIINVNYKFTKITGYSKDEVIGKNPRVLKSGCHNDIFYQNMWNNISNDGVWQGEILNRRKNGEIYPEELTITPIVEYNVITHYIGIFSDITCFKETQDRIRYLEFHDNITNTYNKKYLESVFPDLITNSQINNEILTFINIDIDRFSNINSTYSQLVGDKLLNAFASRITTLTKKTDILVHLNSDEFLLTLLIKTTSNITTIAERLLQNISQPFYIDGYIFNITASLGIVIFQENGVSLDVLIFNASLATYKSKKKGRNCYTLFNQEYSDSEKRSVLIETELHNAVKNDEFFIVYQPILNIITNKFIGAEALLRWNCTKFGNIKPSEFIPLSEETGIIYSINEFILSTVLQDIAKIKQINSEFKISINVSMSQFKQNNFIESLKTSLNNNHINGKNLSFEFTELIISDNISFSLFILNELQKIGITIEIDDFGSGYSNISQLYKFPITKIKIDKLLTNKIHIDSDSKTICKTIIQIAKNFELHTTAKNIEKQEQIDYLQKLGCEEFQGYLISKPLKIDKLLEFITN